MFNFELITEIAKRIESNQGRLFFVGGFVRDSLMGQTSNDVDLTVTGLSKDELRQILSEFGNPVEPTGPQSFPVIKLGDFDFALARRDNRLGMGWADVSFETENVSIEEDLGRRDFTCNAIAKDVLSGEIIDPFFGKEDIKFFVLRAIDERFSESCERGLRMMQQASRFEMRPSAFTISQGREVSDFFPLIPEAQIRQQFIKLFDKGKNFSIALEVLLEINHAQFFPGLEEMRETPQNPEFHPEGNVLEHTGQVMTAMAIICNDKGIEGSERHIRMAAALVHDIAKPTTTIFEDGKIKSPKHAALSKAPALDLLCTIAFPKKLRPAVIALARHHMKPHQRMGPKAIRKTALALSNAGTNITALFDLAVADVSGRSASGTIEILAHEEALNMMRLAEEMTLEEKGPEEILKGRHLIELGLQPGPEFGKILQAAFDAQLEGQFENLNEGLHWLKGFLGVS